MIDLMNKFNYLVLILVILILAMNLFFIVKVLNEGRISGFVFSERNEDSPSDVISDDNITANTSSVTFFVDNPLLVKYSDSGSMLPFIDKDSTGVFVKPDSEDKINAGDVITFRKDGKIIVHRIVEKGQDDNGVYFITKGDNNNIEDERIRFEDIDSMLVAVIY
jgi:signal peptidase I